MSDPINVEVTDGVSPQISAKLKGVATDARAADAAVKSLQATLSAIDGSSLNKLRSVLSGLSSQFNALNSAQTQLTGSTNANATAQAKLAQSQSQAAASATAAQTAQQNLQTATVRGATATQQLLAAQSRVTTATTQSATATARLATEQQRTATQTANAAAASDRAALAALRLSEAQQRAATASTSTAFALSGYIRAALAAAGIVFSVKSIVEAGDAYTTLQNKLQNVASSQEQVNELTERLFDIAVRSRQGIDETVTSFTRFDRALKTLGKSQEDSLRLTETVNKALIVSGATTQESASALLQLSQAFNSGKLQGDEFRAVSENLPIVLDAVAKALNVPINKVKELSSQGKITSKVLFDAFKIIEKQIDDTFAKTTPTVSSALQNLRTESLRAFGELNKSVGFTDALAKGVIVLSNNVRALTLFTVVLGTTLLVAFGPTLLAAISRATIAALQFSIALSANPVGLLVIAIVALGTAFALFGDKVKIGNDSITTFRDLASATVGIVKDKFDDLKTSISKALDNNETFQAFGTFVLNTFDRVASKIGTSTAQWRGSIETFFESGRTGFAYLLTIVARTFDLILNRIVGFAGIVGTIISGIPSIFETAFGQAYNFAASGVEKIANAMITGLNVAREAVGNKPIELIKFDKVDVDADTYKKYGQSVADAVKNGFDVTIKPFETAVDNVFERAQLEAQKRLAAQKTAESQLRGSGKDTSGKPTDKAAEARALALEKINKQLDDEAKRLFTLQPAREAQAKLDQIEETLLGKKIKLNDTERASILAKITANQKAQIVQKEFDRIYEDAIAPARDYNATIEGATKLLDRGVISQAQYAGSVANAAEKLANSLDPIRSYTKELNDQLKVFQQLPRDQEAERLVIQARSALLAKDKILTDADAQSLRDLSKATRDASEASQAENQILSESFDKQRQLFQAIDATAKLKAAGTITPNEAATSTNNQLSGLGFDTTNLQTQANSNVDIYAKMYAAIDKMKQEGLIKDSDYAGLQAQIFARQQASQLQGASNFFNSMAVLSKSKNKSLAAIGKSFAIAGAITDTYKAATGAYASLASIPYVGPFLGAAAAAAAIAAGLANVAQIRSQPTGFKQGGYTGDFPIDQTVGQVHGKEFVFDAQATQRIGVANLESIRRGAQGVAGNVPTATPRAGADRAPTAPDSSRSADAGAGVTVNHRTINVLDPNLVGDYLGTAEGERVMVNFIGKNSDTIREIIR